METNKEDKQITVPESDNVGKGLVRPVGIVLTATYLVSFTFLLLYGLVVFWPKVTSLSTSEEITLFFWKFSISNELALLIVVALAGTLGSLVHTLRSLCWYTGIRDLRYCWLIRYVLLPFVGLTLSLVFYFVIRGGFFSPQAKFEATSPFGFVALGSLVGLFSEQAIQKLKDVSETLLAVPKNGKNNET